MAGLLKKIWSGADFWDKQENQQQRDQFAQQDEEERRKKAAQAAASSVRQQNTPAPTASPVQTSNPSQSFSFDKPLYKIGTSQSDFAFSKDTTPDYLKAPYSQDSIDKRTELDQMTNDNMDKAREDATRGESWMGRNILNRKAIEERAKALAKSKAAQQFQDKYGWNNDPVVGQFFGDLRKQQDAESARLKKDGENLDSFSRGMDKVGEVAGYVPVTGSVINLGLAGTEKLAKATGNDAYGADIEDQRLRLDVGMNKEEFSKLPLDTQKKLRNLQTFGLALSPLDFLGAGGLAKSGVTSVGKKAAMEFVEKGSVELATRQALKELAIAEGKKALIPAAIGTAASVGAQGYIGGKDNIDPISALKTGALAEASSLLMPEAEVKASVEDAVKLSKASSFETGVEVVDGMKSPNVSKSLQELSNQANDLETPAYQRRPAKEALVKATEDANVAQANELGVGDTPLDQPTFEYKRQVEDVVAQGQNELDNFLQDNPYASDAEIQNAKVNIEQQIAAAVDKMKNTRYGGVSIPDATSPMALAKADVGSAAKASVANDPSAAPVADFSNAVQAPLQKMNSTAQPVDVASNLEAPQKMSAPVDNLGNENLSSDVQAVRDLNANGMAVQRGGSQVGSAEDALAVASERAAKDQVSMAAPNTRAEAVNLIDNEAARLDAAETFKAKDTVNIADTQARAVNAIRQLPDESLVMKYSSEPDIKTPQDFFESVAAVERLGRGDSANPASVRALTNALDGLSSFSSRAGRDLRMVKELFANLPPEMRKQYLIDRIESKLGADLPDMQRSELLGKITAADNTQAEINNITGRLEKSKQDILLGAPVDEARITQDVRDLAKLKSIHEYQQGDAFQYSQDLLPNGTVGARIAQGTRTAMLSSPLRRAADVVTTGIASASDTTANAISGLIGRVLNKATGNPGKFRETRAGDYGKLFEGNAGGLIDTATSLTKDQRKVTDIMGELQKSTRADANGAKRTRAGRLVGDMTEAATNLTQGQYDQKLRELVRQSGQKLGLSGDDLDTYTRIAENIPTEVQKHEASQYHLRTNNLHDNKLNTVFRSIASVIDKQFPNGGPIATVLTVPFKSYQAGNLNRLFTDKTLLGNVAQFVKSVNRGDTQGMVDAIAKGAVNTGETLVMGTLLSKAGILKDTNDNGEDFAGPYVQTPVGDIPVGFFGPAGLNILVGHNLQKYADGEDVDTIVNNTGRQAISFMNIEGSLGGNTPAQELISGQGDITDRAVKAGGDMLRRPIPSALGDINAIGNTITGQEKPAIKAYGEDGKVDYLQTEKNRTMDKLGLSTLLDREEGKTSQNIIDRITGGTHSSDATNASEVKMDTVKSLKDMEKQLKEAKVPLKDGDIQDAIDGGDYEGAIKGIQFKLAKAEADDSTTERQKSKIKDELLQAQLQSEGVPVTEDGIKARTESGDFESAIIGQRYQLQKLSEKKDVPPSKLQAIKDDITKLQITQQGSYPASIIKLYSDTSNSEWRSMGNPESDYYNPELYNLLANYDSDLTANKVSGSDRGKDRAKFIPKNGGSGGGGGGGSKSNKGFSTDIARQTFSGKDFTPQKAISASSTEPKSAIPTISLVPNNDTSKLKKITVSKRGKA